MKRIALKIGCSTATISAEADYALLDGDNEINTASNDVYIKLIKCLTFTMISILLSR